MHLLGDRIIRGCQDVTFDLAQGQFLLLRGPNGAGKSSVLKCIYRNYLPTFGSIRYRAQSGVEVDLASAPEEEVVALRLQEIGYVTQFLKVVPRVPTRDVVAEGLLDVGWDREQARLAAEEMLQRIHLAPELWEASPLTFSGGEQQRVNLVRAMLKRPRLLLLDEPTASLDPQNRGIILSLLAELKAQGTGIIAVFHDMETVRPLVDDVVSLTGSLA